jgi:hypothetical protein
MDGGNAILRRPPPLLRSRPNLLLAAVLARELRVQIIATLAEVRQAIGVGQRQHVAIDGNGTDRRTNRQTIPCEVIACAPGGLLLTRFAVGFEPALRCLLLLRVGIGPKAL